MRRCELCFFVCWLSHKWVVFVLNCNELSFVLISKGESDWSSSVLHVVFQTTRCLDVLFILMGVLCKNLSFLSADQLSLHPGLVAWQQTSTTTTVFTKAAKSFQMVAKPQSLAQLQLFKPIKLSHFSTHHASSRKLSNRCNSCTASLF